MLNFISEDQIEQALVQKLQHLHGFDSLDCHTEDPEDLNDGSNRASKCDVILLDHVREAALRLNPKIPATAIEDALEKLQDKRLAMSLVAANQEVPISNITGDDQPLIWFSCCLLGVSTSQFECSRIRHRAFSTRGPLRPVSKPIG